MKNVHSRIVPALCAFSLLLGGCSLRTSKPAIAWQNYGFGNGLGDQTTAKSFIGTPFDSGCPIAYFGTRNGSDGKEIWGSSTVLIRAKSAGAPWEIVEDKGQFNEYMRLLAAPSGTLWVANRCSLYASRDGGVTWTHVYDGPSGLGCAGWNGMSLREDTLWAVGEAGIVVSIDTTSFAVTEVSRPTCHAWGILAASGGGIFLAAGEGLFRSTDGESPYDRISDIENFSSICEDAGTIWALGNGEIIRLSQDGTLLWRSGDAGLFSFRSIAAAGGLVYATLEIAGSAVVSIIDPSDSYAERRIELGGRVSGAGLNGGIHVDGDGILYVGLAGRVMIHEPGASDDEWLECPFGISSVKIIETRAGETWAGLDGNGVARYEPASDSWTTLGTRLCGNLVSAVDAILIGETGTVLLGGGGPELAQTDDSGQTFRFIRYTTGEPNSGVQCIQKRSDGAILLTAPVFLGGLKWETRVYLSIDGGQYWIQQGVLINNPLGETFGKLVFDAGRNSLWYACNQGLLRGDFNGGTWELVPQMYPGKTRMSIDSKGWLWVAADGPEGSGIYCLDDSDNWQRRELPFPASVWCTQAGILVDEDGDQWIGTSRGLYYGVAGRAWYRYGRAEGLPSEIINSISVTGRGTGRTIWIGTQAGASRGSLIEP